MLAALKSCDFPVAPVDIDSLPSQARNLLPEWTMDYVERRNEAQRQAQGEGSKASKLTPVEEAAKRAEVLAVRKKEAAEMAARHAAKRKSLGK